MTERSTRRAAEMAVIDAACAWRRALSSAAPMGNETSHLVDAIDAYNELALALPTRHVTGNANPDTSHAAGASLGSISGDARKVFDEIVLGGGLTCDQVEQKLNRTHQSMSARVHQLRDMGWITDSGMRRKTRSGRKAIVWRPTLAAINQGGPS